MSNIIYSNNNSHYSRKNSWTLTKSLNKSNEDKNNNTKKIMLIEDEFSDFAILEEYDGEENEMKELTKA